MTYTLKDFAAFRAAFDEKLKLETGEPMSCALYDCVPAPETISVVDGKVLVTDFHIAEACNIADLVTSTARILSLPRSNVACEDLSEIFLVQLDILREYIRAASPPVRYIETETDKSIRAWAGFIKHPKDYVFAHRCLADLHDVLEPDPVVVDSEFLRSWDRLSGKEKDQRKSDLAHRTVVVELPESREVLDFIDACATHLSQMILQWKPLRRSV